MCRLVQAVALQLGALAAAAQGAHPGGAPLAGVQWFVDPITVKIMHDRRLAHPTSAHTLDLAAQRGECERAQLWGWSEDGDLSGVKVEFADLQLADGASPGAAFPKAAWGYKQQGYVNVSTTHYYTCHEDILTGKTPGPSPPNPPPNPGKAKCGATPWDACTPGCPYGEGALGLQCAGGAPKPDPSATCNRCTCGVNPRPHGTPCHDTEYGHPCLAGWYPDPLLDVPPAGMYVPKGFTQPIFVEVCVPYGTPAGNYSGALDVVATSGPLFSVPVKLEVWAIDLPHLNDSNAFNTAFTFASTEGGSNLRDWYPNKTDAQIWADWFPFLSKHRIPGDMLYLSEPRPVDQYKALARSGAKWMNMLDAGRATYPEGYVAQTIAKLAPVVQHLSDAGLLNKTYVYGFDEMHPEFNQSVYDIFGGIKKHWPQVRTIAVLDWESFPADLPLNVWVDEYADYGSSPSYKLPTKKETLRQAWLSSGETSQTGAHSFWWYWCIGPADSAAMNTFVERPAIEARLLYWLAALHAVDGMLYYEIDIWANQCPSQRPCRPIGRIGNTALTDFNPATWNGNGHSTDGGGANGDGSFTYPGKEGPVGTIRLANIADGIEDWELFNRLGHSSASISHADDLISRLVSNMTEWGNDGALLEQVRREAARRIMAAAV